MVDPTDGWAGGLTLFRPLQIPISNIKDSNGILKNLKDCILKFRIIIHVSKEFYSSVKSNSAFYGESLEYQEEMDSVMF